MMNIITQMTIAGAETIQTIMRMWPIQRATATAMAVSCRSNQRQPLLGKRGQKHGFTGIFTTPVNTHTGMKSMWITISAALWNASRMGRAKFTYWCSCTISPPDHPRFFARRKTLKRQTTMAWLSSITHGLPSPKCSKPTTNTG